MTHSVVDLPGLPPGVEVRRSTRRRRTVTAYREGGRTIVVVPQRMARADIGPYVEELVGRLEARERRAWRSDTELLERARQLSARFLEGRAEPAAVRWVSNQHRRWGSCTPADRSIRLSDRLVGMPEHVVDYVLLHELVHLLVPGHGADFEAWMRRYPRLLEARAFLAGVDHALGRGLLGADADSTPAPDDDAVDADDTVDPDYAVDPDDTVAQPDDAGEVGPPPVRPSSPAASAVRPRPGNAGTAAPGPAAARPGPDSGTATLF